MSWRRRCSGRRAFAKRGIKDSKQSAGYSRMGGRRHCKGGVLPLSEALSAASGARSSDAWAAAAIAKGGVRALSEAWSAASEASATAAWADATDAKGGVRPLSEASRQRAKRRPQPHGLPPPLHRTACCR